MDNKMLRSAIERQIEIIGEAASKISTELKHTHTEIPWKKIIAQRHVLAHEYDNIVDEILWNVCKYHIPPLIPQLESLLPDDIPDVEL